MAAGLLTQGLALVWVAGILVPQPQPDLIVVIDGSRARLDRAEAIRQQVLSQSPGQEPEWLLIRCRRGRFLNCSRATTPPPRSSPQRLWIVTDPSHTPRGLLLAQLALAGRSSACSPPIRPHRP